MMEMAVDKKGSGGEETRERIKKSTRTGETRKGVCYVKWQKRK